MIHSTKFDDEITVVRPGVERLTAVNANDFKTEVCALIDAGNTELIVDFEEVTFIDSSGLGALVGILKKLGHRGDIVICTLAEDVESMFRISRMDRVFSSFQNLTLAIQSIKERS